MKRLSRKDLVDKLYERFNGVVDKYLLREGINVMRDMMINKLIDGESIFISNFGTLYQYTHCGHNMTNISTKKVEYCDSFIQIKFIPHENLIFLVKNRISK